MENRIFPENYGKEKAPEVVHYESEAQRESEAEILRSTEKPPIAVPHAPVFSGAVAPSVTQNISGLSADSESDVGREVAKIMRVAKEKGVEAAVNMVRGEEPVVIDAAHDAMVEDLEDRNTE